MGCTGVVDLVLTAFEDAVASPIGCITGFAYTLALGVELRICGARDAVAVDVLERRFALLAIACAPDG